MSNSTELLKKKVCVTVFLDELFEEVQEEDRRDLREVSSKVKIPEKPLKKPSRINLNTQKGKVSSGTDYPSSEQTSLLCRPRKHRKESIFLESRCDSFKNDLSNYGCNSSKEKGIKNCEPIESEVESYTDLDLDEAGVFGLGNSKTSFSELSDFEIAEENFLPVNSMLSSKKIPCLDEKECSKPKPNGSNALFCNKFTQAGQHGPSGLEVQDTDEKVKDGRSAEEDRKDAAWKETQRQAQAILTKAKSRHTEKETYKCQSPQRYDLKSILEECVRKEEKSESRGTTRERNRERDDLFKSDALHFSDSYTCVFPHKQRDSRKSEARGSGVNKVRTREEKKGCSLGSESGASDPKEADGQPNVKEIGPPFTRNDSLLCYTLCLRCRETVYEEKRRENDPSFSAGQSADNSESTSRESSYESLKSKASQETDFVFRTGTHFLSKSILNMLLERQKQKDEGSKMEGDLPVETGKMSPLSAVEPSRIKNFAEGDTFVKPLNQAPKPESEPKQKFLAKNEILKSVEEGKIIQNNIIVNRAEVTFSPGTEAMKPAAEVVDAPLQSPVPSSSMKDVIEVFFKPMQVEFLEKSMTDAESEMIFAESENSCENEDCDISFYGALLSANSTPTQPNASCNDVCVVEFEDKLSRSKVLKRMKTLEILGENSVSGMKNISTEVILICENLSNNEVSLEAWQSSATTLKSISEMRQCYLKDSKDSSMYLIEIPLHFTRAKKGKVSPESRNSCSASSSN